MSESLMAVAQRMSQWQKMRERLNKMTSGLKRLPAEYLDQVEKMREADSQVRNIAERELPAAIKGAQKAFKQRRLLDVAHNAAIFNSALKRIVDILKPLNELTSEYIDEFYIDSQEADPTKDFFAQDYAKAAINDLDMMVKEAELFDLFRSDRNRAARMIEKLYKVKVEQRNNAVKNLIDQMDQTSLKLNEALKELAVYRSKGDIAKYIETQKSKVFGLSNRFENTFKRIYNKHLAELQTKAKEEAEKRRQAEAEDEAKWQAESVKREESKINVPEEEIINTPEVTPSRQPAKEQPLLELELPEQEPTPVSEPEVKTQVTPSGFIAPQAPGKVVYLPGVKKPEQVQEPKKETQEPKDVQTEAKDKWKALQEKLEKEPQKAASRIYEDIKLVAETQNVGQLVAICSYYSQELEDQGDIQGSMKLLAIAESLINE